MDILESSKIGNDVIKNKENLIIGLSIKNSYFKYCKIEELILWASKKVDKVFIMIPDKPAVFTLRSLGIPEIKALRKARLEGNRLENKCKKIIRDKAIINTKILRWSNIECNKFYIEYLEEITSYFNINASFRESVESRTKIVVSKNGTLLKHNEAIRIGSRFVLQELAFIGKAAEILAVDKVAYLYHSTMQILKELIEEKYPEISTKGIGFITAK